MIGLLDRPLGIGFSVAGAVLAGAPFKRAWKLLADEDEAPKATQEDRTWGEVLTAAALQGRSSPWSRRPWTAPAPRVCGG
jgi:hypothetical protein